ncbi:hypothetical protein T06_8042 [Trichinella sp. T6]|nr:hypothetical protein T06_8042 [Trichinella sp. T6]
MARFAGGITSKEAYLAIRLQEPTTLTEAQRFVTKVMRSEEHFHQRRQTHTGNSKPEKTETTQSIDDFIREVRKLSLEGWKAGKAGADCRTTRRKKRRLFQLRWIGPSLT